MTDFCMPSHLEPAAWEILQQLFNYRIKTNYEKVRTAADVKLHVDLSAVREENKVLFNIHGNPIISYTPDSIQWKYASYQNWCIDKWGTITFSQGELDRGLSTIYAKFYEGVPGSDEFSGFIVVKWHNGLQRLLRLSGEKQRRQKFWCLPFDSLFNNPMLRQQILAYDLEMVWHDRPKHIQSRVFRSVVGNIDQKLSNAFYPMLETK